MPEASRSSATAWRRHDFVWIGRAHADLAAVGAADADDCALVAGWVRAGRPFVVRCQADVREPSLRLAVGLPLCPAQGKRRVAIEVPLRAIDKFAPPPRLADVVDASPAPWRESLTRLVRHARAAGVEFNVFGSLAWQSLTGLRYVTNGSDLDLCWRAASREQLDAACRLLASWQRVSGIAVDGEIGFGDDLAVAWREWLGRHAHPRLLVKGLHGAALMAAADLLATCDVQSAARPRAKRTA
jgi:phosphoribosyl-dephospho-CoA transferase